MERQGMVSRIERQEDRTLIYLKYANNYHIIAKPDVEVNVGDEITYEPYGQNFGWFLGGIHHGEKL